MRKASTILAVVLCFITLAKCDAYVRSHYKRNYFRVLPLMSVLDAYHEKHSAYPSSAPRPIAEVQELKEDLSRARWQNAPLRTDDLWGHAILYASDGHSYVVWSVGKDGVAERSWEERGYRPSLDRDVVIHDSTVIHEFDGISLPPESNGAHRRAVLKARTLARLE